jgi:hypothetical protein
VDDVKRAFRSLDDDCYTAEVENDRTIRQSTDDGGKFINAIGWKAHNYLRAIDYEARKASWRTERDDWSFCIKEGKKCNAKKEGKITPVRPQLSHIIREGVDYRNGRDATGDDLINVFGFRGIEFGNYENQLDRQQSINHAYDALMDLTEVLKIPPKSVSLKGTLGLAFGSRGSGRHSAHYEPTRIVINLTKMSGAGSLAHEFGHALDDYLYILNGKKYSGEYFLSQFYSRKLKGGFSGSTGIESSFYRVMGAIYNRIETKDEMVNRLNSDIKRVSRNIDGWWRYIKNKYLGVYGNAIEKKLEAFNLVTYDNICKLLDNIRVLVKDKTGKMILKGDIDGLRSNMFDKRRYLSELGNENLRIVDSNFYKEAKKLDSNKSKKYWSEPEELFARAFESYVLDRLNGRSDYLVHSVKGDTFSNEQYKGNPYPAGAERNTINEAFDGFVESLSNFRGGC